MAAGSGSIPGDGAGPPARLHFRASDADRECVIDGLKTAFAEGRLTKDEYDTRVGQVLSARTYADLGAVTRDLPVPGARTRDAFPLPRYAAGPQPSRKNSLATAALVLGLAQFVVGGGILGIPAIILGTKARRQIRQTGESGYDLATAGLVLGWIGVTILVTVLVIVAIVHL